MGQDPHESRFLLCLLLAQAPRHPLRIAREAGCNAVVLVAQHLDDLAESFLMNPFYTGDPRTMEAHYVIDAGDLRVIRPLVYPRAPDRSLHPQRRPAGDPGRLPGLLSRAHPARPCQTTAGRRSAGPPRLCAGLLHAMRPLPGDPPAAPGQAAPSAAARDGGPGARPPEGAQR